MSVSEQLMTRLGARGWQVRGVSTQLGRAARLADMLAVLVAGRRDYDLVHLDVFSGAAFLWAEAVSAVATPPGQPQVLTPHGGPLARERTGETLSSG